MFKIFNKKNSGKMTFQSIYNKKTHVQDLDDFDSETRKKITKLTDDILKVNDYEYRDFLDFYNNIPEFIDDESEIFYKNHIKLLFEGSIYLTENINKYREISLEKLCSKNKKILITGTGTNPKIQALKSLSNFGTNEFFVIQNYNDNFDATIKIFKNENFKDELSINVIFKDNNFLINKIKSVLAESDISIKNVKRAFSNTDIDYLIDIDEINFEEDKMELIDIINQITNLMQNRKKEILTSLFTEISNIVFDFRFECIKDNKLLLVENIERFEEFEDLRCFNLVIKDYTDKDKIQHELNKIMTSSLAFKSLTPLVEEINIFEKSKENTTYKMKYGSVIDNFTKKETLEFMNDILYDYEIVLTHSPKGVIEDDFEKMFKLLIETGKINKTTIITDEEMNEFLKSNIARLPDLNDANQIDIDQKIKLVNEKVINVENFRSLQLNQNNSKFNLSNEVNYDISISKIIFSSLNSQNKFLSNYELLLNSCDTDTLRVLHKDIKLLRHILIEEFVKLFFTIINNNIINATKGNDKLEIEKFIYNDKDYLKEFLDKIDIELKQEKLNKLCSSINSNLQSNDENSKENITENIKSNVTLDGDEINFYTIFIKTFIRTSIYKDFNINISIEK